MKKCPICGTSYADEARQCPGNHTSLNPNTGAAPAELAPELLTLTRCLSLQDADLVASRLKAAGLAVFIPDENLMHTTGFALNTYGNVRVQTTSSDYDQAVRVLRQTV